MRGAVASLVLVGLIVMAFGGRATWSSGGGVVLPHLSARFAASPDGATMYLTNTGNDTVEQVQVALDRWNLERRFSVCAALRVSEEVAVPLPHKAVGSSVYVFAARYPFPAWFQVPAYKDEQ